MLKLKRKVTYGKLLFINNIEDICEYLWFSRMNGLFLRETKTYCYVRRTKKRKSKAR